MNPAGNVPVETRQRIEHECTRLVLSYAHFADTFQDEAFAALFTEDGLLHRGDGPLVGRAAIRAAMGQRRRDAVVRHVMTNILVEVVDDRNATGIATLTLYRHFGSSALPAPMMAPEMIAHYHDRYALTAEGWRIAERRAVVAFRHPDSTH